MQVLLGRRVRNVLVACIAVVGLAGNAAAGAAAPAGDLIQWGQSGEFPQLVPTPLPGLGGLAGRQITSFDAGPQAACAVADGGVYCWGTGPVGSTDLTSPRIEVPTRMTGALTGRTVTSVSVGDGVACAVADGAAYCWGRGPVGDGSYGSALPVAVDTATVLSGKTVSAVSVAGWQAATEVCVVADNVPYCWGELGTGAGRRMPGPIDTTGIPADKTVTAIAADAECLIAEGALYCWNAGRAPFQVDLGGRAVTAVSGGTSHRCALAVGSVFCWGAGRKGQLGNGAGTYSSQPVPVDVSGVLAGKTVSAISVGGDESCAIAQGRGYCWGRSATTRSLVPAVLPDPLPAVSPSFLATGGSSACAVATGQIFCWGSGIAPLNKRGGEAFRVPGASGLTRVEGDCGIMNGRVACWKSWETVMAPEVVQGLPNGRVNDLSVGTYHACAVVKGRAYCWGQNPYGQLGTGTHRRSAKAVPVRTKGAWGRLRVTSISAGETQTCAVADAKAYCWGSGDLGRPGAKKSATPIRVALAKRVSAVSVGAAEWVYKEPQDEEPVFTGRTDVCAVAGARLYCWGWNTYGQLGLGHRRSTSSPTLVGSGGIRGKNVSEVSLSRFGVPACAVADGRAYCWGSRAFKPALAVPARVKGLPRKEVTEVAVGARSCALIAGRVWYWGEGGASSGVATRLDVSHLEQPGRVVDISEDSATGVWQSSAS